MIHALGPKGAPRCGAKDAVIAPNLLDVSCVPCLRKAAVEYKEQAARLEEIVDGSFAEEEHTRLVRATARLLRASSKAVGTAPGLLLPELLGAIENVRQITGEWNDA